MAAHRTPAPKIQAIFRFLQHGVFNYRKHAKELSITRNTLKKYVASIQCFQAEYPDKKEDGDFYLKQLQERHRGRNTDHFLQDQIISAAHAIIEGGSRKAEWQKYHNANPKGYRYSQFCSLFAKWCKENYQSIRVRQSICYKSLIKIAMFFSDGDDPIIEGNGRRHWHSWNSKKAPL